MPWWEYETHSALQDWFIGFLLLSLFIFVYMFFFVHVCVCSDDMHRYKTVLGETIQTDTLFSSCSLRSLEESLFCQAGHVGSAPAAPTGTSSSNNTSVAWDAYWERNEPLRDVDEVAIPVLSVCAQDDPVRGDSQATVPLELFETNPHFFLLLTDHGGHCGFSTQSEGSTAGSFGAVSSAAVPNSGMESRGTNWSHKALLEFFRATTDFFAAEERAKQLAARRRGLGGGAGGRSFRHRSVSTCKRVPACSHNIHAIYNWQRSYTRWGSLMEVNGLLWCFLILFGFWMWRTQLVLCPCDTQLQSVKTARTWKVQRVRSTEVIEHLLSEGKVCVVLTHLMWAIKHKDREKAHDRPQACMQLLCLTAEQLTLNSEERWQYIFLQISSLPAVKTEGFCHSFMNTHVHLPHILHSLLHLRSQQHRHLGFLKPWLLLSYLTVIIFYHWKDIYWGAKVLWVE